MSRVSIEFIFDRNVNSELNNSLFHALLTGEPDSDNHKRRTLQAQVEELHSYLQDVSRETGIEYRIIQRDTAQLFHEKTNLFTPELARARNRDVRPDFLGENLRSGHYIVEPPLYGEDDYYRAVRQFLEVILPEKDPAGLEVLHAAEGQEKMLVLQDLYWQHIRKLPNEFRHGRYEQAYEAYREARFNAGETSVAHFIEHRPPPAEDEHVAVVFVGRDNLAIQQVLLAGADRPCKDRMDVFAIYPKQFRDLVGELIRQIEDKHPEMAEFRKEYPHLREVPVPKTPAFPTPDWLEEVLHVRAEYRRVNKETSAVLREVMRRATAQSTTPQI